MKVPVVIRTLETMWLKEKIFLPLICGDFFECFSDEEQPLPCGWLVVAQSCCARHQSPQLPFANSINVWPNTQKNCGCRECM